LNKIFVLILVCGWCASCSETDDGALLDTLIDMDVLVETFDTPPPSDVTSRPPVDVVEDTGPNCLEGEGCFEEPCDDNDQCNSGYCIEHLGGSVCTDTCESDSSCPEGWNCKAITGGGADVTFICVFDHINLCRPCNQTTDCADAYGGEKACVDFEGQGSFCATSCKVNSDCPESFHCGEAETLDGAMVTGCLPTSGNCQCSDKATQLGLSTTCSVTNEVGTCLGDRICGPEGLSACSAATPQTEGCDGLDNDCDGESDEGLGETSCGLGVCEKSVANCVEGTPVFCDPFGESTPEICDGLDNDCDGNTDEELGETVCGQGACKKSVINCLDGTVQLCDAAQGSDPELCDGLDNDCDGEVDEDLGELNCGQGLCTTTIAACIDGTTQACEPPPGSDEICDGLDNDCDGQSDEGLGETTCGLGVCTHNVVNCVESVPQFCNPFEESDLEVCDGLDNNCNGDTDEDLGSFLCGLGACAHPVANCSGGMVVVCDPLKGSVLELCDGIDNDCDGKVDEDLGELTCGEGACLTTVPVCLDGKEQVCIAPQGEAEICDGIDNDCDGMVDDEGLGETTCGLGVCTHSVVNCVAGVAQFCNPFEGAGPETCDGLDNDCDGEIDEQLGVVACGLGVCAQTKPSCSEGVVEVCDPFAGSSPEVCDGLDNDCDGETDEDLGDTTCGQGPCLHTVANCVSGVVQICNPSAGSQAELCDGIDNDCDGEKDEDLGESTCGQGQCVNTTSICVGGVTQACNPYLGSEAEVCDGLDNDCDGKSDEALGETSCGIGPCKHTVPNCIDGEPQVCNAFEGAEDEACDNKDNDCNGLTDDALGVVSCGKGECAQIKPVCIEGEEQMCDPTQGMSEEICDGLDNDCNGDTDENMGTTTCGKGECAHTTANCLAGTLQVCDPFEGVSDEVCDGQDNNCNGSVDEGLGETSCGKGPCVQTIQNCVAGVPQVCDPFKGASDEICDGQDNNCNGTADEALGSTNCGDGPCAHTVDNCVNGVPQTCDPFEDASPEVCDGIDNDCDGQKDEGFGQVSCGQGPCAHTVSECLNGVPQSCDPFQGATPDVCDGIDNNCDGETDEGCPVLGEQVTNPEFNNVSGKVCGNGIHGGPSDIGGTWMAFVRDTHPFNGYGCGSMCAGASGSTGWAGGTTGAGCNAWVYQCVQVPFYSKITLSYRYKVSSGIAGSVHGVYVHENCSNGPPDGNVDWRPYGGENIYKNASKPANWTDYSVDLTAELAPYKGKTVFIGLYTNNSWAASYNPNGWIDDVHLIGE
jgi:hypothetical protein